MSAIAKLIRWYDGLGPMKQAQMDYEQDASDIIIEKARELMAEEEKEKPTAPAGLVEFLDRGRTLDIPYEHWEKVRDFAKEILSRYPEQAPEQTLAELAKEILKINTTNGWNVLKPEQWEDTYKIPGILALIHSEVSEALEGFRRNDKKNFEEELADVIIRVLDCSGGLGLDMDKAIADKLEKNKARGFRHGGKKV